MNYKQWICPYLTKLEDYKAFLQDTPGRIAELEDRAGALRAARTDKIVVSGGGTDSGDALLIDNLAEREELAWKLRLTRERVDWLENALDKLTAQERLILDRFYIHRTRDTIGRLMLELNVEQAQVYRLKDRALERLARILTGILTV